MPASSRIIEKPRSPIINLLDTVGDLSGDTDFAVNFAEPTTYQRKIPAGTSFCISEISVNFIASGGISPDGFGSGAILTNGIRLQFVINGVDVFAQQLGAIKSNYELSLLTSLVFITDYIGVDKGYLGTLDIHNLGLDCVVLNGDNGDSFQAIFDDDFTSRISIGTIILKGFGISNS